MSLKVIGYDQGKKLYRDEGPGTPAPSGRISGSIVVGQSTGKSIEEQREIVRKAMARHRETYRTQDRAARAAVPTAADPCSVGGRCRHDLCMKTRRKEAARLRSEGLSHPEIGLRLGGRSESTVRWLLGLRADAA